MPKRKLSESNISGTQSPTRIYKKTKKLRVEAKKSAISKKKLVEDQNQFQDWERSYFVTQNDGKTVCLICRKVLSTIKKSDIEQHYMDLHEEQFSNCSVDDKIEVLKKLKNSNCLLPLLVNSPGRPTKPEVEAEEEEEITLIERQLSLSYGISLQIAREGSPLSHGEVIKKNSIDCARGKLSDSGIINFKMQSLHFTQQILQLNIFLKSIVVLLFYCKPGKKL